MNKINSNLSLRFYLLLFSAGIGILFLFQLLFIYSGNNIDFLVVPLALIGLVLIILQILFISVRFEKELYLLWKSIRQVIDHNFSRKFKLHVIKSDDEIGRISKEVSILLEKLHHRTTEVLQQRKELFEAGKNIEKLGAIGRDITSKLTVHQIIQTTFANVSQLLDASLLSIGIFNIEKNGLDFYGIRNGFPEVLLGFEDMKDEKRWGVHCYNLQQEVFCNEFDQGCGRYFSALLFNEPIEQRESFIYLPLTLRDERIGVFTVQSFQPNAYTVYHLNLLRNLANYIMVALTNANAYSKIEQQKNELELAQHKLLQAQLYLESQVAERTRELRSQKEEIEQKNIELERLSLVARKTDNAIMIMDAKGNIEWINDCFTRIYKYNYENFIAKRGKNLLQTSFHPDIQTILEKCIRTKKSVYYEAANLTCDGREIWTQTTLTPVLNSYGDISHLLTIDSDISKRKEYELTLTRQAHDITQSIIYAKQIQSAALPPSKWFEQSFANHFILFKPKDIVSGDFYWLGKRNDKTLVALADCTGHGVPGAFMSMLGISLLNEIVHSPDWQSTGELLNLLRTKIKSSLRQNHAHYNNADGMDIAVCLIDKKQNSLQFSGANNSLYLVRNKEIIDIKGDKMPIGIYINDDLPFSTYTLEILNNDQFYLSTDGYIDQFGGEKDTKFMSKRFKQLLVDVHELPFNLQRFKLDETIMHWKGQSGVQIDDICVVGFKVE